MPIDSQALAAPENRYLHLRGEESLREAFRCLIAPGREGQPWWHLVVSLGAGKWAIASFDRLYARAQEDRRLLDCALRDLDGLLPATVVEQESMGTARARRMARNSPSSVIAVARKGVVVGLLCAPTLGGASISQQDVRKLAESGLPSGPGSLTAPGPQTVRRHADVSCPAQVALETRRFNVVVRLTVEPALQDATSRELTLTLEEPVRVELQAPDFELLNEQVQEIRLLPDRDSPPVVFDLRPRQIGAHPLEINLLRGTEPLGTVTLQVQVTKAPGPSRSVEGSLDLPSHTPGIPPPDLLLRILWTRDLQGPSLRFLLLRQGGTGWDEFPPVPLHEEPAEYARRLFTRMTDLAAAAARLSVGWTGSGSSDAMQRELRTKGQNLWEILPAQLRALYADERAGWRDRSLLIISDEPHIPWELIWPWGDGWEDEEPWCLTLRLSRWLRRDGLGSGNSGAPGLLPLRSLACLASGERGLPAVMAERRFLDKFARRHGLEDRTPPVSTHSAMMALLEAGGYDLLHIATHGSFSAEAPDQESALLLEDRTSFTPEDFVGSRITHHLRQRRPAFVFNACESARQSWGLVGLGGWASRLLHLGAGMFLGSLWPVNDAAALSFAEAFYERFWAGEAVAEALRQARLAIRKPHDPTWLAYSLYSHPNARVVAPAAEI